MSGDSTSLSNMRRMSGENSRPSRTGAAGACGAGHPHWAAFEAAHPPPASLEAAVAALDRGVAPPQRGLGRIVTCLSVSGPGSRFSSGVTRVAAGLALAAVVGSACTHPPAPESLAQAVGVAPRQVLETFLAAANCVATVGCAHQARSLETMGRLFGTREGPLLARDPRALVERRMYALAALLRADTFVVGGERVVPGRTGEATGLEARVRQGTRETALPVTMVRAKKGGWLVESLEVDRFR